jgi:hypothetical protein
MRRNSMDAKLDAVIRGLRDAGSSGLRTADISELGGWARTSVPVYVSRMRSERGCRIRKVRGYDRYVLQNAGRLANETAPAPVETRRAARAVELSADTLYRTMPAEVSSFYTERAVELASR